MIPQIDAAAKLNEELKKLATDPVKDWMDSVPNWIEAGKQIEMGAINSLRDSIADMIKTGKLDFESLGEAILCIFADVVSDKAVKELLTLFGRGETVSGGWLGGLFGDLFASQGDSDVGMVNGGTQAGAVIGNSMITAGTQVAAQIQAAMAGAGAQAGMSVQSSAALGRTDKESDMSGYVYAGAPSPLGMFDDLHHQRKTERLRALFQAGVPVIASGDGLTATPAPNSKPRPPRDTWNDSAPVDGDGELGTTEW